MNEKDRQGREAQRVQAHGRWNVPRGLEHDEADRLPKWNVDGRMRSIHVDGPLRTGIEKSVAAISASLCAQVPAVLVASNGCGIATTFQAKYTQGKRSLPAPFGGVANAPIGASAPGSSGHGTVNGIVRALKGLHNARTVPYG